MRSYLLWTEGLLAGRPHRLNDVLNPALNQTTEKSPHINNNTIPYNDASTTSCTTQHFASK